MLILLTPVILAGTALPMIIQDYSITRASRQRGTFAFRTWFFRASVFCKAFALSAAFGKPFPGFREKPIRPLFEDWEAIRSY